MTEENKNIDENIDELDSTLKDNSPTSDTHPPQGIPKDDIKEPNDDFQIDPEFEPYYDKATKTLKPEILSLIREERSRSEGIYKRNGELRNIISRGNAIYDNPQDYLDKASLSQENVKYIEENKEVLAPVIADLAKNSVRYGETDGQFASKVVDIIAQHSEYSKTAKTDDEIKQEFVDNAIRALGVENGRELEEKIELYNKRVIDDRFLSKESKEIYSKILSIENPYAVDTLKLITELVDSNMSTPVGLPPIMKSPTIGETPKTSKNEIERQMYAAYDRGDMAEAERLLELL